MRIQLITLDPRPVADAPRGRLVLLGPLSRRPPQDPERTLVIFMCAYARDLLAGTLPRPYRPEDARRYAQACLS